MVRRAAHAAVTRDSLPQVAADDAAASFGARGASALGAHGTAGFGKHGVENPGVQVLFSAVLSDEGSVTDSGSTGAGADLALADAAGVAGAAVDAGAGAAAGSAGASGAAGDAFGSGSGSVDSAAAATDDFAASAAPAKPRKRMFGGFGKGPRGKNATSEGRDGAALGKLKRDDYLRLLTEQSRRIDALEAENAALQKQLQATQLELAQAMSFREAADRLDKLAAELGALKGGLAAAAGTTNTSGGRGAAGATGGTLAVSSARPATRVDEALPVLPFLSRSGKHGRKH